MSEFYVEWRIEIDAEDAEDAARKALVIQRRRDSIATVFHVWPEGHARVDAPNEGDSIVIDLEEIAADARLDSEECSE